MGARRKSTTPLWTWIRRKSGTQIFRQRAWCRGEPDASSFPSGGLRATFEARGYTAWDPTSPRLHQTDGKRRHALHPNRFLLLQGTGAGQKAPLLRSMTAVTRQAKAAVVLLWRSDNIRVGAPIWGGHEYFWWKRSAFTRPDTMMCGRTLFGNVPPKHQQMETTTWLHQDRVLELWWTWTKPSGNWASRPKRATMKSLPGQFEIRALFESRNLAVDHNMLVMRVLRKTANKHDMVCLLHRALLPA